MTDGHVTELGSRACPGCGNPWCARARARTLVFTPRNDGFLPVIVSASASSALSAAAAPEFVDAYLDADLEEERVADAASVACAEAEALGCVGVLLFCNHFA